jgi:hypothetical protein
MDGLIDAIARKPEGDSKTVFNVLEALCQRAVMRSERLRER